MFGQILNDLFICHFEVFDPRNLAKRSQIILLSGGDIFMQLPLWLIQFLAGGAGGFVRGLVGVTKDKTFNPDTFKFQWKYFAITLVVSMIVGQLAGVVFNGDWRASLLAGYAGSDFLESIYKLSLARFFK